MLYRFRPSRLLRPLFIFLCLIGISYLLNPDAWHHLSVTSEALFAGASIAILAMIFFVRGRMYLRIDDRGIEIKYAIGEPRHYRWMDIDSARIQKVRFLLVPLSSSIQLRLRSGARLTNPIRIVAGSVTGANASFPAFFDLGAEEIIEQIKFYKSQPQNISAR